MFHNDQLDEYKKLKIRKFLLLKYYSFLFKEKNNSYELSIIDYQSTAFFFLLLIIYLKNFQ